jgi:hypothetical protein
MWCKLRFENCLRELAVREINQVFSDIGIKANEEILSDIDKAFILTGEINKVCNDVVKEVKKNLKYSKRWYRSLNNKKESI